MFKTVVILFLTVELIDFGLSSSCCSSNPTNGRPIVDTTYGRVRGRSNLSRYKRLFYSFNGIPYAKPPLGELRFREPVPPNRWTNIRDASQDGPMCIQLNYLLHQDPPVEGEEDCLHINVYTPKLPSKHCSKSKRAKSLLPVMVSIHFGGFFCGTGNRDITGPEYFMDKDVVLVSFNYRLGVFGFLSTNNDASPGNWGFKDQVAALKWVRNNIENFGGNRNRVTIIGQSAGAAAVHYHLLTPVTKNLFHAAITESGTALTKWAIPDNILRAQYAKQQATFVGCDANTDSQTMVDCLRGVDATTLAESSKRFKYFSCEPIVVYAPVIERRTAANPNPYITEDPVVVMQQGRMHRVPWINGIVQQEGILRASSWTRVRELYVTLSQQLNELSPRILELERSVPREEVTNTWNSIRDFFFPSGSLNASSPESVQGLIDLIGDRMFNYGPYQTSLLHAWRGHSPIWFYHFAYKGRYSFEPYFATTTEEIKFKWGVSHCDELIYLFPSVNLFPPLDGTDLRMSDIMVDLWTNFATYFHPTPIGDAYSGVWQPLSDLSNKPSVKNSDLIYLNITGSYEVTDNNPINLEMNNKYLTERMFFWESLPLNENIDGIE